MPPHIVLLVDDDADFRGVLADLLRDEGYRTVDAENGEEALRVLDSLKPDVIIIDLIMPVVNGWALFDAIEKRSNLHDVPLVFLSAVPQMSPGGGSLVLKKPLNLSSLLTLLNALRPLPPSSEIRLKAASRTVPSYRLQGGANRR